MSMTALCPNQLTSRLHVTAAVQEAAASEGGRVINEHYSLDEYVKRRGHYLAAHADYKHCQSSLFPIARRDADEIFQSTPEQLSVQEVRRREIQHQVFPLLPLPTTANTATMDNFQSYPSTEWSPNVMWPTGSTTHNSHTFDERNLAVSEPFFNQLRSPKRSLNSRFSPFSEHARSIAHGTEDADWTVPELVPRAGLINTTSDGLSSGSAQATRSLADTAVASASYRASSSPFGMGISTKSAAENAAEGANPGGQTANHNLSSSPETIMDSIELRSSTNTTMSLQTSTRASSVLPQDLLENGCYMGGLAAQNPWTDLHVPQKDIANFENNHHYSSIRQNSFADGFAGQKACSRRISAVVMVDPSISALSGRGIHVPVKTKRGTKRAASPSASDRPEHEDLDEHAAEVSPPPKKRLKLNVRPLKSAHPVVEPAMPVSPTEEEKPSFSRASRNTVSRIKPKNKTRSKPKTVAGNKSKLHPLESVIGGTELPKSAADAKVAADIRYQRLLTKRNEVEGVSSKRPRIGRGRKAEEKPDILPEFFWLENFPKGEEDNTVRCICGVMTDDSKVRDMISCEYCQVWQHNACMGEAVPKDLKNGEYFCHVCDPWLHRKLIAEMRREHS